MILKDVIFYPRWPGCWRTARSARDFGVMLSEPEEIRDDACRAFVAGQLALHAPHVAADARSELVRRTSYVRTDVHDADALRATIPRQPILLYVATPPAVVPLAVAAIRRTEIDPSSRIILDKPFGLSRASARSLNDALVGLVDARHVFRIDRFLYHHVVQELVRWRVEHDVTPLAHLIRAAEVEVVWDETRVADTGGARYCGVIRDMVQSHLLHLVALATMDSPHSLTRERLARSRLGALRRISAAAEHDESLVRAHHLREVDAAAPLAAEGEETLATFALRAKTPQWEETLFRVRAAKGVQSSRRHIKIKFVERSNGRAVGFLRLGVLAGKLIVGFVGARPSTIEFDIRMSSESPSVRLLRDALVDEDTFTLLPEEPEECWRIVEPVIRPFKRRPPMLTYRVGAPVETVDRTARHAQHG